MWRKVVPDRDPMPLLETSNNTILPPPPMKTTLHIDKEYIKDMIPTTLFESFFDFFHIKKTNTNKHLNLHVSVGIPASSSPGWTSHIKPTVHNQPWGVRHRDVKVGICVSAGVCRGVLWKAGYVKPEVRTPPVLWFRLEVDQPWQPTVSPPQK